MIARVLLAAILCGIAAGLALGLIQHVRLTPLILEAEKFEHVAHGHSAEPHAHGDSTWSPADGLERTMYTVLTTVVAAVGFSLLIAGAATIGKIPLNTKTGWIWGLCGFAIFAFAPALGLPPELPGMPSADLSSRTTWWLACVVLTGAGIWGIYMLQQKPQLLSPAIVLLLFPHVLLSAPYIAEGSTQLSASLAAHFVTASLGANLVMWLLIGVGLGFAFSKFLKEDFK